MNGGVLRVRGRGGLGFIGTSALLGLMAFGMSFPTLDDFGLTWDEPLYFDSVERIQGWVGEILRGPDRAGLLAEGVIREVWDWDHYRNLHPPAFKIAMAATDAALGSTLGPVRAYRIAPLGAFALLVMGVSLLAGWRWGPIASIGAGLSLAFMPRVVGHGHIGATDIFVALSWFGATSGLAAGLLTGRKRLLAVGSALLGFGLATKFTLYLLPLAVFPWAVLLFRGKSGAGFTFMVWGVAGLALAWAMNPLAWHDPLGETFRLVSESISREDYAPFRTFYLGRAWDFSTPWHHALVMAAVTVPIGPLVLSLIGGLQARWRATADPIVWLCLTQIAFFLAVMALESSPNHDGVRLFLPIFPFMAVLGGRGFAWFSERTTERVRTVHVERPSWIISAFLCTVFFLPAAVQTAQVSPYNLSYYSELIGGVRGASVVGMETTYWLEAVNPRMITEMNAVLPQGSTVSVFPNAEHFWFLQRRGLLRDDLKFVEGWDPPPAEGHFLLLIARKGVFRPWHHTIYERGIPVISADLHGVLLAGLYAPGEIARLRAGLGP